jgi:hypothetical protein
MKKVLYSIAATLVLAASAHAQAPAASPTPGLPLDQLYPGYQATVLESPAAVNDVFNSLPREMNMGSFLVPASQCFQRAEVWSYDMYKTKHINPMKIFIFYTYAYKKWFYHESGHTFAAFSKTPLNVYDWSRLDIDNTTPCKEGVRYQDFKDELENGYVGGTVQCYLVRVPGTDYDPVSVEDRDSGKLTGYDWDMGDVNYAVNHAVQSSARKDLKAELGL